jgi:hypothetical protein
MVIKIPEGQPEGRKSQYAQNTAFSRHLRPPQQRFGSTEGIYNHIRLYTFRLPCRARVGKSKRRVRNTTGYVVISVKMEITTPIQLSGYPGSLTPLPEIVRVAIKIPRGTSLNSQVSITGLMALYLPPL